MGGGSKQLGHVAVRVGRSCFQTELWGDYSSPRLLYPAQHFCVVVCPSKLICTVLFLEKLWIYLLCPFIILSALPSPVRVSVLCALL